MIGYTGNGLALRLYPGAGDGTFGTPGEVSLDANEAPTALASGDLDGDGRIDFAVAYESGLVRVVMGANTADLSLGASMTITEGSFPRSVVIADLDGDGDLDVATANSGVVFGANGPDEEDPDGRVSIFRNDGTATFAADSPIVVASYPMNVEAGDLNGDGYPDLSVVHLTDFGASTPTQVGIEVLISDAQGGFLGPEETLVGYAPFSHVIVDLDGDGLNDAVVADPATSLVTVLRNELTVALDHRATPRTRFATNRGAAPEPATASLDGVRLASLSPRLAPGLLTRPRAADVLETASYAGYWYHNDHLGTPQVMTDENRDVVWEGFYKPFGEVATAVEDVVNSFRFPGQYEDGESKISYNTNRLYRPQIGRYLAADPLVIASPSGAPDSYSYAGDDPVAFVDQTGLARCHYNISAHTLVCVSNRGGSIKKVGPDGVKSGTGACQDNPSPVCLASDKEGPIQPGKYRINPDSRSGHADFHRLENSPKSTWYARKFKDQRSGFLLHPGYASLGCITVNRSNHGAMQQYSEIDQLLDAEAGDSQLDVSK